MKKAAFLLVFSLICPAIMAQEEFEKELRHFTRIIASPRVNLILKKGDKESVKVVYNDVNRSRINVLVKNKTLHIFLDDARRVERRVKHYNDYNVTRHGIYDGVTLTAYVTYKDIECLEIRGNQELTVEDMIDAEQFKLKAYGENEITLASLKTEFFKATLYGENRLKIKSGRVVEQKYRLFGENKIDTQDMRSEFTSTSIFGEGRLKINSSEEVRVDAFGEPQIFVDGGANINKRLVFGKASIYHK